MKPSLYHALKYLSLALILSTTGVSAVSAADNSAITPQLTQASEAGHVELSEDELSYKSIHQEVMEAMDKLEESGGGMKPLRNYLAQIDNAFEAGDQEGALKKLNSLKEGVDRQLANVKDIKARKLQAKKAESEPMQSLEQAVRTAALPQKEPARVLVNALQEAQSRVNSNPSSATNFRGSANDYLKMVVKDIVARELGTIALPVNGPFRLERFRIAQRISELQKGGQDITNYLAYYNKTEEIARAAKHNPGRIGELSGNVQYLSQQLQLPPLSGSLSANARAYR